MKDIIWVSKSFFQCQEKCVLRELCSTNSYTKTESLGECLSNGGPGYYKFREQEPEEIQSEYEWKKERYDLLRFNWRTPNGKEEIELKKLDIWLKDNKPEIWETCTKENTKAGDRVRFHQYDSYRTVKYVSDNSDVIIVRLKPESKDYSAKIGEYEINTSEGE